METTIEKPKKTVAMDRLVLYKRSKTGKVVFWSIVVHSNEDRTATITKNSGQINTISPIIHKEHITQGKNIGRANETSPKMQAVFQAESDAKKKLDEGYKSAGSLGIRERTHDTVDAFMQALEERLPKDNTDSNGNTKPMLATDWEKVKSIPYPVIVQPKLDGVRCLLIVKDETVTFLSRTGKPYDMPHIEESLKNHPEFPLMDFVLDGELYTHGKLTFQEAISAIKKHKPETALMELHVYDMIPLGSFKQKERLEAAQEIVEELNLPPIKYVEGELVHGRDEVIHYHNDCVEQGYEGAIIRFLSGKYISARSRELLKVKEFDSEEFDFLGFEQGQREEDLIARCRCPGGEFKAKMVGTAKEKAELLSEFDGDHREDFGQITVKFFGLSDGGIPRFPVGLAVRDYE